MGMLGLEFAKYMADNQDRWPDSVESLIDQGFVFKENLISPFGPASDGKGDYVFRYDDKQALASYNARLIIGIDRAMLIDGNGPVVVAFGDFHVEIVDRDRLQEILDSPLNQGAAEALDLPNF